MRTRHLAAVLGGVFLGALDPACADDSTAGGVAAACKLNSDCAPGLVCSSNLCHAECTSTRDCPSGTLCVKASGATVCQFSDKTECTYDSDCIDALVCGSDGKCRNQCKLDKDCVVPQVCAKGGFCAEPTEVNSSGELTNAHRDGGLSSGGHSGRGNGGASGSDASRGGTTSSGGAPESGGAPSSGGSPQSGGSSGASGSTASGGSGGAGTGGRPPGTGGASTPTDAASDAPDTVTLTITNSDNWCTYAEGTNAPQVSSGSFVVPKGSVVSLSATPSSGFVFGYWTGTDGTDGGKDRQSATTVTMDSDKTVAVCCPPQASPTIPCP